MPLYNPAVSVDYPFKLKPNLVRWVIPGWLYTQIAPQTVLVSGRIVYVPIFVSEATTYIRIGVNADAVTGSGTIDLRIFAWLNGLPGALILSAGTVSTATIGIKEITISQALARSYYFLAYRGDAAAAGSYLNGPDVNAGTKTPVEGHAATPIASLICPTVTTTYSDPAPSPTGMLSVNSAAVFLREN